MKINLEESSTIIINPNEVLNLIRTGKCKIFIQGIELFIEEQE